MNQTSSRTSPQQQTTTTTFRTTATTPTTMTNNPFSTNSSTLNTTTTTTSTATNNSTVINTTGNNSDLIINTTTTTNNNINNNNNNVTVNGNNNFVTSPISEICAIQQFFENLGELQFSSCLQQLQKKSQQLKNLQKNFTQNSQEEILQNLQKLINCEMLYFDANFSPNEKQDLHSLYSLLGSNLQILAMNAPYEFTMDIQSINNKDYNNKIINLQNSEDFSNFNGMDYFESNFGNSNNGTLQNSDYILYKSLQNNNLQNITIIDQEFILSKQLIKEIRILLQLRLEIIAFYRMVSRYSNKSIPKIENYLRIINILKSKYINRITHNFLKKIILNLNLELNTLMSIFQLEIDISNFNYKESIFSMWKVKSLFKEWNGLFFCNKNNTQHVINNTRDNNVTSSSVVNNNNLLLSTMNVNHPLYQSEKIHNNNLINNNFENNTLQNNNSPNLQNNSLNRTNLYKWMQMLYNLSCSKFNFIFYTIIQQQQNKLTNVYNSHKPLPTASHLLSQQNKQQELSVDYLQWIKNFTDSVASHLITVCLVLNNENGEHLFTESPNLDILGYQLPNKENPIEKPSGIKCYPCIFHYPTTIVVNNTTTTNNTTTNTQQQGLQQSLQQITKLDLMYTYWPNLLSLIMENESQLEMMEEPFYFNDNFTNINYYICNISLKIYLVTIIKKSIQKDHLSTISFMSQMNNFLRNKKLFQYLTSVLPIMGNVVGNNVVGSGSVSGMNSNNVVGMVGGSNDMKEAKFSFFRKKK